MHLTFDQWIKLGEAVGGLGTFGGFLHLMWRRIIRPIFTKVMEVIEEERKFRVDTRETIKYVAEFRKLIEEFNKLLKTDDVHDFVELIQWASAMRRYADVKVVTKMKKPNENGGIQ